jgi:dTDP-4-amino-4,6-dideoxygalactose transaminase
MFRGLVDKYTWVDVGSSALPSDILAAFLYAQLEARGRIQAKRRRIWERYARELPGWADARGIGLPFVPAHCEQPNHLFYLVTRSLDQRSRLIAHLKQREILAVFHYLPLHLSEMGQRLGGKPGDCPITEDLSDRVLRLPFYNDLSEEDQTYVIDSLHAFDR